MEAPRANPHTDSVGGGGKGGREGGVGDQARGGNGVEDVGRQLIRPMRTSSLCSLRLGQELPMVAGSAKHPCIDLTDESSLSNNKNNNSKELQAGHGPSCTKKLLKQPQISFTKAPISSLKWSCPRCTFRNLQENLKCEICGYEPPSSSISEKRHRKPLLSVELPRASKVQSQPLSSRLSQRFKEVSSAKRGKRASTNIFNLQKRKQRLRDPAHQMKMRASNRAGRTSQPARQGGSYPESKKASSSMWIEKYMPQSSADLCLHPKKIAQVREWIQNAPKFGQKLLVLTGPPGSGKSTTIRALAKEMNSTLSSWSEDPDAAARSLQGSGVFDYKDAPSTNKLESFRSFLLRGRYSSLGNMTQNHLSQQMVLIEDIPFTGSQRTLEDFRDIMMEAINQGRSLMVMIATDEHENSSTTERLLGPALLSHPKVAHISFNPVNATCLSRALNRIATKEGIVFTRETCKELVNRCKGDLRQAVLSLQFASLQDEGDAQSALRNEEGFQCKAKKYSNDKGGSNRKRKGMGRKGKKRACQLDSSLGSRDEALSIFHALGKILYKKRGGRNIEDIVESSCISPEKFVEFLQWNCISHLIREESKDDFAVEEDDFDFFLEDKDDGLEAIASILSSLSDADYLASGKAKNYGNSLLPMNMTYASSLACRSFFLAKQDEPAAKGGKRGGFGRKTITGPKASRLNWDVPQKARRSCDVLFGTPNSIHYPSSTEATTDIIPYIARIGPSAMDMNQNQIEAMLSLTSFQDLSRPQPSWGPCKAENTTLEEQTSAQVLAEDDIAQFSD